MAIVGMPRTAARATTGPLTYPPPPTTTVGRAALRCLQARGAAAASWRTVVRFLRENGRRSNPRMASSYVW